MSEEMIGSLKFYCQGYDSAIEDVINIIFKESIDDKEFSIDVGKKIIDKLNLIKKGR